MRRDDNKVDRGRDLYLRIYNPLAGTETLKAIRACMHLSLADLPTPQFPVSEPFSHLPP